MDIGQPAHEIELAHAVAVRVTKQISEIVTGTLPRLSENSENVSSNIRKNTRALNLVTEDPYKKSYRKIRFHTIVEFLNNIPSPFTMFVVQPLTIASFHCPGTIQRLFFPYFFVQTEGAEPDGRILVCHATCLTSKPKLGTTQSRCAETLAQTSSISNQSRKTSLWLVYLAQKTRTSGLVTTTQESTGHGHLEKMEITQTGLPTDQVEIQN